MDQPAICQKGGRGLFLPLGGDGEQEWPRPLRIALYLLGLGWTFMGVAIIADVFMTAIEKVTSKKVRRFNRQTGRWYTFKVWNATVANLTLMALGSSAPEIMLNVIDIFAKEFFLEGLGPGTIVGSAAFNLLMIIAVCIMSIPDGQVRFIKDLAVYACTATFSVLAYLWLIIILLLISPHVVELWEGVLSFLFFPMLIVLAWLIDKGILFPHAQLEEKRLSITADISPEEIAEAEAKVRAEHGNRISSEQVARILAVQNPPKRTRAHYRIAAIRGMVGGKKLHLEDEQCMTALSFLGHQSSAPAKVVPIDDDELEDVVLEPLCSFEFPVHRLAVLESVGSVNVKVRRTGNLETAARVFYTTIEGTAKEVHDFVKTQGWLEFRAGVHEATIKVPIVDDENPEEDEYFSIVLSQPEVDLKGRHAVLGPTSEVFVTIIDDDEPGTLRFEDDAHTVYQRGEDFDAQIRVNRSGGSCGEVKVKYVTEGDTAVPGRDFEHAEGEVVFSHQQVEAWISVRIRSVPRYDCADRFRIILFEPEGGAKLDASRDGGKDQNILTVTICIDSAFRQRIDNVRSILLVRWDKSKIGHDNWASQFKEAWFVNGGDDEDDEESPSIMDKVMHYIALPWKLFFALVPPVDFCGGWVCFCCSLIMIGLVTAIIGDMASLLGCVLCIPDDITAITFVALGTSLPDTFASRTAAVQDPYADASVGNVTGSNSVNVFLGLGLPWMIAAIRWAIVGKNAMWDARYQFHPDLDWLGAPGSRRQAFVVPAGSLAFSVTVFTICAVLCIILLALRRWFIGGELGGPRIPKLGSAAALVLLWFLYIGLSAWKSVSELGGARCAR